MAAVWVPPGKQTFIDPDTGAPLSFGTVQHFIPSTTTPKTTWADQGQGVANPATITLDGAGQCVIWGNGLYRQVLKDAGGTQLWDQVTGFVASGGGGGGDVFGPGASTPGHVAVWTSSDGTQIGDGGVLGALASMDTIGDGLWAGSPLALNHGGTGATTAAGARTALGLTHFASDSDATMVEFIQDALDPAAGFIKSGSNMTIVYDDALGTLTFNAALGGGAVTGPGASTNGELVLFNGATGSVIKQSGSVPSANGLSYISAANYAAMRTLLSLTHFATDSDAAMNEYIEDLLNPATGFIVQGSNMTITYDDALNTLTFAASLAGGTVTGAGASTNGEMVLFSGTSGAALARSFCTPSANALTFLGGANYAAMLALLGAEPAGQVLGVNTQTASYTLVLGDAGKVIEMNVAGANILTVPPNSAVAFPVKTRIDVTQIGAGQCTITAGVGVTIRVRASLGLKMAAQWSGATLYQRAADEWVLIGDVSA